MSRILAISRYSKLLKSAANAENLGGSENEAGLNLGIKKSVAPCGKDIKIDAAQHSALLKNLLRRSL